MLQKQIRRLAQLYGRNVLKFPDIFDVVKQKGYTDIALCLLPKEDCEIMAMGHTSEEILPLIDAAGERGLSVSIVALYQKQKQAYLAEHPDQVMRLMPGRFSEDQDKVTVFWGCPFNPDFQQFYLDTIREAVLRPAVREVWFNSEAFLGSVDTIACYCQICRADYRRYFGNDMPEVEDWENPEWVQLIKWRIGRWVDIHGEMRDRIRAINPNADVSFLASGAIDLWGINPWVTGVDLSRMGEVMDSLITNPYFHFHEGHGYSPIEVYATEWSRFMRAMVPQTKPVTVVYPGFNHPTFKRPLAEPDGYWAGVLPLAAGATRTASFEYSLQRATPMQDTYEAMFRFDPLFEAAKPIRYSAVIHSFSSEVYAHPQPSNGQGSYDLAFFRPSTEALRLNAVPYNILADRGLTEEGVAGYKCLLLTEISSLSAAQNEAISAYWRDGGGMVICGDFGSADQYGGRHVSILRRELGIDIDASRRLVRIADETSDHPVMRDLDRGAGYLEGDYAGLAFGSTVKAVLSDAWTVLSHFRDSDDPAVAVLDRDGYGRVVYVAGVTARNYYDQRLFISLPNHSHALVANAVRWAARELPPVRLSGYPPLTESKAIRPRDPRVYPTGEFFTLAAPDYYMAVIASYFKEKMDFALVVDIPHGRELHGVTELISGESFDLSGESMSLPVSFGFHDCLKLYKVDHKDRFDANRPG